MTSTSYLVASALVEHVFIYPDLVVDQGQTPGELDGVDVTLINPGATETNFSTPTVAYPTVRC